MLHTHIKGQGWEGESSYAEAFHNFGMTMQRGEPTKTPSGCQFNNFKNKTKLIYNFVLKIKNLSILLIAIGFLYWVSLRV